MQMQQLRYFLEVAKTQNITVAARNLYVSQPSLSQQIINLEKELGVSLLIRHSKSVTLTDAGEQFSLHARRIMNGVDQLSELMQKHSLLQEGIIRLGLLSISGYLNLFQILYEYKQLYPGLSYDLKINESATLMDMLRNHSIHAAFLINNQNRLRLHEEMYYLKVIEDYYVAVVSKENPLSRKELLSVEDLKTESIIMPSRTSAFRNELEYLFDQSGFTPRILCETSQSDIVIQMASKNLGVGFASCSIAQTLKTKNLAVVPLKSTLNRTIYYVTLKELLDYPSIRSFTDFIEQYTFSKL